MAATGKSKVEVGRLRPASPRAAPGICLASNMLGRKPLASPVRSPPATAASSLRAGRAICSASRARTPKSLDKPGNPGWSPRRMSRAHATFPHGEMRPVGALAQSPRPRHADGGRPDAAHDQQLRQGDSRGFGRSRAAGSAGLGSGIGLAGPRVVTLSLVTVEQDLIVAAARRLPRRAGTPLGRVSRRRSALTRASSPRSLSPRRPDTVLSVAQGRAQSVASVAKLFGQVPRDDGGDRRQ